MLRWLSGDTDTPDSIHPSEAPPQDWGGIRGLILREAVELREALNEITKDMSAGKPRWAGHIGEDNRLWFMQVQPPEDGTGVADER